MSSSSAISGPVKRNLPQRPDRLDPLGLVCVGRRRGAEDRSSSPDSPSARYLANHLLTVRTLIPRLGRHALPATTGLDALDEQSPVPDGQRPRVSVQPHPVSSLASGGLENHQPSKGARMNNVPRSYI